jgi:hypothetical protein
MMKEKVLESPDGTGLDQQVWAWTASNPNVVVKKRHPIARLPLPLNGIKPGEKLLTANAVSMRVDYTD